MKKSFILIFIVSTFLYSFEPIDTKITAIRNSHIRVDGHSDIKLHATGVVLKEVGTIGAIIVAKCEVVRVRKSFAILKISKFEELDSDALPSLVEKVSVGDVVRLNYGYSNILPILPDAQSFKDVTLAYPKFNWVHPDLFASYLLQHNDIAPDKRNFQDFCRQNEVGLIFFANTNSRYFIDCDSFKAISKDEVIMDSKIDIRTPFYNTLDEFKASLFQSDFEKKDYFTYYNKLFFDRDK